MEINKLEKLEDIEAPEDNEDTPTQQEIDEREGNDMDIEKWRASQN